MSAVTLLRPGVRLTLARWRDGDGDRLLAAAAVTAQAIVTACALLLPIVAQLSVQAAVLGARGREQRLASLRLLGLSSGDVTLLALLETVLHTAAGALLGAVLSVIALGPLSAIRVLGTPLSRAEMTLPLPALLGLLLAVVLLSVLSSAAALRRVRISPLSMARRAPAAPVSVLRLLALLLLLAIAVVTVRMLRLGDGVEAYLILAGVLLLLSAAMDLVGPWLLQLVARLFAQGPGSVLRCAAQRILMDPRTTWRRVAALGTLSFPAGFFSRMPQPHPEARPQGTPSRPSSIPCRATCSPVCC